MNDEIKEKIDFIKQILNRNELIKCSQYFNDLLDYITNLQQENETLHENNQDMQEEMARVWEENERLKELQQENERLKFQLENQQIISSKYRMRRNIYKSRCEKAIEYIKKEKENYLTKGCSIADTNNANLIVSAAVNTCDCSLNILQNGSESQ